MLLEAACTANDSVQQRRRRAKRDQFERIVPCAQSRRLIRRLWTRADEIAAGLGRTVNRWTRLRFVAIVLGLRSGHDTCRLILRIWRSGGEHRAASE